MILSNLLMYELFVMMLEKEILKCTRQSYNDGKRKFIVCTYIRACIYVCVISCFGRAILFSDCTQHRCTCPCI